MENNINKKNSVKSRFNIVDIIVILIAAAIVFGFFWSFDPFDWFDGGVDFRDAAISYVVEIKGVDNELVSSVRIGDNVIDNVSSDIIGNVTEVTVQPSYEWVSENGEMIKREMVGKSDMFIEVTARCIYKLGLGYGVNGNQITVGSRLSLRTINFSGVGYCISMKENGGRNE